MFSTILFFREDVLPSFSIQTNNGVIFISFPFSLTISFIMPHMKENGYEAFGHCQIYVAASWTLIKHYHDLIRPKNNIQDHLDLVAMFSRQYRWE